LNRDVALKVPRPEVLLDRGKLSRFEGEALATASLDYPAIVPLYEAQLRGATPFLFHRKPATEEFLDVTGSYTVTLNR
jgi:eukaryotic-like serine/threonine-protein kinase